MKYDWQALDSQKELRTWQIKMDIETAKTLDWLVNVLKSKKLEEQWTKKIALQQLPSAAVKTLAQKVSLESKEFVH
jgi:hypothetical protein